MTGRALTLVTPLHRRQVPALEGLLREMGDDVEGNAHLDFTRLATAHFLRWVIVPPHADGPPQLVFESNHDGPPEAHLDELLSVGGPTLARVYGHCVGCPEDAEANPAALRAWLLRQAVPEAAFYRAYPHLALRAIRDNTRLRRAVGALLDAPAHAAHLRSLAPTRLVEALREHLRQLNPPPELSPAAPPPASAADRLARLLMESWPLQLGAGLTLLPLLAPAALVLLWKEAWDEVEVKREDVADERVVAREDWRLQNQLTHLVEVKPGRFRQATLRAVLGAIDLLARHYYNRGQLGGIPTIHFARWVLLDGGRRLLFFSNYDGSWERYLGDFIDKASVGLSAVWSNTRGFPRTWLLVLGGARDEEAFKDWARRHQLFTQVWYSAHTQESVRHILANARLREGMARPLTPEEAHAWLLSV